MLAGKVRLKLTVVDLPESTWLDIRVSQVRLPRWLWRLLSRGRGVGGYEPDDDDVDMSFLVLTIVKVRYLMPE